MAKSAEAYDSSPKMINPEGGRTSNTGRPKLRLIRSRSIDASQDFRPEKSEILEGPRDEVIRNTVKLMMEDPEKRFGVFVGTERSDGNRRQHNEVLQYLAYAHSVEAVIPQSNSNRIDRLVISPYLSGEASFEEVAETAQSCLAPTGRVVFSEGSNRVSVTPTELGVISQQPGAETMFANAETLTRGGADLENAGFVNFVKASLAKYHAKAGS